MKHRKAISILIIISICGVLSFINGFNIVYADRDNNDSNGLGKRNDVLEGNNGAGITDSSKDKDGNNLKERMEGKSLNHSTGGIDYTDLVYLQIPHYDFNGNVTTGEMVVNKNVADEVLLIFQKLYKIKYPIQKMVLVDQYYPGNSDFKSIEDNNTSAFNERTTDSRNPSNHAKGLAIDINPLINPMIYVDGARKYSSHNGSALYVTDRINMTNWNTNAKAACINPQTEIYKIFTSYGWRWLGTDDNTGDTQHFDKQGAESSNSQQIDWSNTGTDNNNSNSSKNKKDISIGEILGEGLKKIWETGITFFENIHTGRNEIGINFSIQKIKNIHKIDLDNFVQYYAADPEWGSRPFSISNFTTHGCGPTCVAMILTNMSGEKITPGDILDWCGDTYSNMEIGGSNAFSMLTAGIKHFGLDNVRVESRVASPTDPRYISVAELIEILKKGNALVLVGLSRGLFTDGGHYVVFAGVYEDGTVIVKDTSKWNALEGRPQAGLNEPYNTHHFTEQELTSRGGLSGYSICYLE